MTHSEKKVPQRSGKGKKEPVRPSHLVAAVDELVGSLPATKTGQVEFLWPRIELALSQGHRPKAIWLSLERAGFEMSLAEFRVYVGRVRKRAQKRPQGGQIRIDQTAEARGPAVASVEVDRSGASDEAGRAPLSADAQRTLDLLQSKKVTFRKPGDVKKLF